ncbi:hypothetical protein [uncultured Hymenobacter sp.]|uniref:hypothetical protein n=1 Tax=uncultured Hymenobacter sp. TaxID=170016 RepID=UPI0035CC4C23
MLKRCLFFLLLLPGVLLAQSETPAQANKRLFDRTVDELNYRTFETVYDKTFTRQKFPESLRTAAARRAFDGFAENPALKQLFLNYNGVAERYKTRFGNGQLTLAEFQRQLNGILRDKNFEFFIRGLPRDERVALIRAEQRYIRQATAQFNASAEPSSPAAEPDEAPVSSVPLTTNAEPAPTPPSADEARQATTDADDDTSPSFAAPAAARPAVPHDWLDYLTLLLSLTSTLLLLYLLTSVLPAFRRRLNELPGLPEEEPGPSLRTRFRRETSSGLEEDHYDDEEAN